MGGWSAVEYALRRTGKLKALVLAATTGTIDPGRIREPERSRLEDWAHGAERARADFARRGAHAAAGAAWRPSSRRCTSSIATSTT